MIRAILNYRNGIKMIKWVDSEPNEAGGYFVNQFTNDGEKVFSYDRNIKLTPVYIEIDTTMEDFYGYEKTAN